MKLSHIFFFLFPVCTMGCGATTLRASVGPTLDTDGRAGIEGTVGLGLGMPVEYNKRSHHYLQAQVFGGGGYVWGNEKKQGAGFGTVGGSADYIYLVETPDPKLIVRAGVPLTGRFAGAKENLDGIGAHIAVLPVVGGGSGGPMVALLCLGPDFRAEKLFAPGQARFSLPLVFEGVVFAAGD